MTVIILFTYGISLVNWQETGLLKRELRIYEQLATKYNIKFKLLTYGDISDLKIPILSKGIEVVPIYAYIKKSNIKAINYFNSLFIGFRYRKFGIEKNSIIKTNQLWGSWVGIVLKLNTSSKLLVRTGYDLLTFKKLEQKESYKIYLFKTLTKASLKFSNCYVVTSNRDREFLQSLFPKYKEKIIVIQNYVESTPLKETKYKKDRIISVGRLEKQKNYEYLIRELSGSKWILDIVGEGSQREFLTKEIDNFKSNVNLIGTFNNEELLEKLTEYKFYVSSTLYEGNPKSILEAMAVGCIVIAPKVVGVNEIIDHGVNGFLYDLKENKLNDLLVSLDGYKLDEISEMAKKYISDNHDFNLILEKEYSIYSKL